MTDTSHRLYAVAIAVVVFFLSWATVAAKPWATAKPDPRLAALAQREQRLRADAKLVQQVVDNRDDRLPPGAEGAQAQIAAVKPRRGRAARALQSRRHGAAAAAASVRVVNLPPLTITRTS